MLCIIFINFLFIFIQLLDCKSALWMTWIIVCRIGTFYGFLLKQCMQFLLRYFSLPWETKVRTNLTVVDVKSKVKFHSSFICYFKFSTEKLSSKTLWGLLFYYHHYTSTHKISLIANRSFKVKTFVSRTVLKCCFWSRSSILNQH